MTVQSGKVLNLDEIASQAKGKCCLGVKEVRASADVAESRMRRGTVALLSSAGRREETKLNSNAAQRCGALGIGSNACMRP